MVNKTTTVYPGAVIKNINKQTFKPPIVSNGVIGESPEYVYQVETYKLA